MPSRAEELSQARTQIEHAQRRIEEQIELIDRLHADGYETRSAELLLVTLLDVRLKFTRHPDALEGRT